MPAPNPDQNEVEQLMAFRNGHLPLHPLHDHLWLRTFTQEKYQTCHLLSSTDSSQNITFILGNLCEAGGQVLDW